ncbi:Zn-dependent exopeptidase [Cristinia sonorae]|uniref:Zn-dependent exopeptidase n=1 Tax=Cristinia sonorae TaxID=1940300 RepID=A0A8K0UMK5_9AGAR|nr:Zn-dependent exopeptidase [Cristinia sonorae]
MENEKLLDEKAYLPREADLEASNTEKAQLKSRSRRPLPRIFFVILFVYTCFKIAVKDWLYELDLKEFHVNWGYRALGGTGRGEDVNSTAKVENLFLSIPNGKSALETSRSYATHPHLAGSEEDFEDAKVILKLFQEQFGISAPSEVPVFPAGSPESRSSTLNINKLSKPTAWIDKYYPVMNTGKEVGLEILGDDGDTVWTADLVEDGDPRDPEAAKYKDAIPAWHGLSADGVAEGEVIYVNYGNKEDYDNLVSAGTNLTGKIVLARYGTTFRGLKIEGAQTHGAIGVLIYSDPRDDGLVTVENGYEPYPAGPARNPTAVQRGSVQFLSKYPGDPTTPGYPAYENATRTEGENIPKIPSIPISWANAQKILAEIGDSTASRQLTGVASSRKVRLTNRVDTKVIPIWNTMAVIPGHIKNETVILGCHRDAWVMGAADPTSGTVSLTEVIRGYGALLKSGWRPLRNILIASWDAEEYGLIGSTEWGEDFADWIQQSAVAYINVDVSVAGSAFTASGSPSLAHLIRKTAKEVPHPTDPNRSLWDSSKDKGPFTKGVADAEFMAFYEATERQRAAFTGVPPLGSGSDYTVFLQRLGVASMDQGFGGTPTDAVYHYHSIYDSQHWQEVYADPTFERHAAVAKNIGLLGLRLADSIILPLNTTHYALELDTYLDRVEGLTSSPFSKLRKSIQKLQKASTELDAEKVEAEKKFKELIDKIRRRKSHGCHKSILRRIFRWVKIGLEIENFPERKFIKAAKRVQKANAKLIAFERGFISEGGIKDREWYKHLGVAPGKWLGYGATTLPGLTEALTIDRNVTLAHEEAKRLTTLLHKLTKSLKD